MRIKNGTEGGNFQDGGGLDVSISEQQHNGDNGLDESCTSRESGTLSTVDTSTIDSSFTSGLSAANSFNNKTASAFIAPESGNNNSSKPPISGAASSTSDYNQSDLPLWADMPDEENSG